MNDIRYPEKDKAITIKIPVKHGIYHKEYYGAFTGKVVTLRSGAVMGEFMLDNNLTKLFPWTKDQTKVIYI